MNGWKFVSGSTLGAAGRACSYEGGLVADDDGDDDDTPCCFG